MDAELRRHFDAVLDDVLRELPEPVHRLLDEVPMYVDDYPSRKLMQRLHIRDRRQLCGLYTGIPLGQRSIEHSGVLSDAVHLFREGILALATDRRGHIKERELRRQIRITVLHELGHLHGMSEAELDALGY
jgi:predicted Zn-dependent protease with MMP-like domain